MWSNANAKKESEARATLAEASTAYWSGNYVRTVQLADQVIADAGGTKAATDARRMKADALFWQGSFDSAATLYQEVLSRDRTESPMRTAVQQSLASRSSRRRTMPPRRSSTRRSPARRPTARTPPTSTYRPAVP